MSNELAVVVDNHSQLAPRDRGYLSSSDVLARMTRILEIQKHVMKERVHFGTIPGTPKPTLYKAGAEKLLATFQVAAVPVAVEDLSTSDEVRYRVRVQGVSQATGVVLGEAWGECSSNEEKYRWRKPIVVEEWNETPEDMRREKWQKGRQNEKPYKVKQVRTSPADVANTILQMATKRALIPMTRLVLACSDIFEQDLEDMPEELRESLLEDRQPTPEMQAPQRRESPAPATPTPQADREPGSDDDDPRPQTSSGGVITDKQAKRFYAIAKNAGWSDEQLKAWLKQTIGTEDDRQIPRRSYDDLCAAVGAGPK
jgi:hypothetical protein